MKKLLWLIACLMTMVVSLTSCSTTYVATANYEVCYPDGVRSYNDTVTVLSNSYATPTVKCFSYGGTNFVSVVKYSSNVSKYYTGGNVTFIIKNAEKFEHIASSTAPIRLNSYTVTKSKRVIQRTHYNW